MPFLLQIRLIHIYIYRLFVIGISGFFASEAFCHSSSLLSYRVAAGFVALPVGLMLLGISWIRKPLSRIVMACYTIVIPIALTFAVRILVLNKSPWWDFLIGLVVIMIVPFYIAWELVQSPEVCAYYNARNTKASSHRT